MFEFQVDSGFTVLNWLEHAIDIFEIESLLCS